MSDPPSARSGYFRGDRMELGMRYAYQPELVPALLAYLGAEDGAAILEVGCGTGFVSRLLARSLPGASITGIDSDLDLLDLAVQMQKRHGLAGRIPLGQGDAFHLPFANNCFDLVTSHRML